MVGVPVVIGAPQFDKPRCSVCSCCNAECIGRGRFDVAANCSFSGSNIYSFGMDVVKKGITVRLFDFGLPHIYVAFIKCAYAYDLPPCVISLA